MPPRSNTSETGGRKSEPSPTERMNPSSTRTSGMPFRAAISTRSDGIREAQTATAPPRAPAVSIAASAVRLNCGLSPFAPRNSATRRRFQNDMPRQATIGRSASKPGAAVERAAGFLTAAETLSGPGDRSLKPNSLLSLAELLAAGMLAGQFPPIRRTLSMKIGAPPAAHPPRRRLRSGQHAARVTMMATLAMATLASLQARSATRRLPVPGLRSRRLP